ncbi:MAG TPA: hypothetical protein VJN92_02180 [Candidatus Acidoferrum sp.]|nr:hypothetical protein [Candidatus Acidoferrum sp.]
MAGMAQYVRWLWGVSVAIQIWVCAVLFLSGNFRKISLFTAYVIWNIAQAGVVYITYTEFGLRSRIALEAAWMSQGVAQLLRVLATTEILRIILRPYRGIWALGWRVLAVGFGVVFSLALIALGRNVSWAIVVADRGFHLAFGVALVACLLLVRYYFIPVLPAYKALLGGFCFYSCTAVVANTVSGLLTVRGNANSQMIWQLVTMGAFVGVSLVWATALRRPLPESRQKGMPSQASGSYQEISSQVNERLRRLDELLGRWWKLEATQ